MAKSPRVQALRLVGTPALIAPPPIPAVERDSPEAMAFLDDIREAHFASLALTIDNLFEDAFEKRPNRPPSGLLDFKSDLVEHTGWDKLSADMWFTILASRSTIRETQAYQHATAYRRVVAALASNRWIKLDDQLEAGINTGVGSTLSLLRNLPNIISFQRSIRSDKSETEAVARHPATTILLRRLAKISVNQMMAAKSAIVDETEHHSWTSPDVVMDPQHFRLRDYRDGSVSLDYADFSALEVPAGYTPHSSIRPITEPTLVRDIPSRHSKVVGCPITLIQGKLQGLWEWGIDAVTERGLWDEEWPPVARQTQG